MKIIIASDSYKNCLSSDRIGEIIKKRLIEDNPEIQAEVIPVADGGEGTMETLVDGLNGQYVLTNVLNPIGKNAIASYGMISGTAIIEMSRASGLQLLDKNERNPLKTTTYGTGMLMLDSLNKDCKDLIIGLGGSATNDGGMGMAEALGVKFYDAKGKILKGCGENLEKVEKIDVSEISPLLNGAKILAACDVTNTLCGKNGAAYIYGPQKGATQEIVERLDKGLQHFADVIKRELGVEVKEIKGSGAAGGLGAGLVAFAGAKLKRGFDIISGMLGLEKKIASADVVVTGEGSTDIQTAFGKVPYGIVKICAKYNKKCYLISGTIENKEEVLSNGFTACYELKKDGMTVEDSIINVKSLLVEATDKLAKELRLK